MNVLLDGLLACRARRFSRLHAQERQLLLLGLRRQLEQHAAPVTAAGLVCEPVVISCDPAAALNATACLQALVAWSATVSVPVHHVRAP